MDIKYIAFCTSPQNSCAVFLQESPYLLDRHSPCSKEVQLTQRFGAEHVQFVLMDPLSPVTYCFVDEQYSHRRDISVIRALLL